MNDPIIEEIYQGRQKLLDECGGGDLKRLMQRLRSAEAKHLDRVVTKAGLRERRRQTKLQRLTSS